MHWHARAIDTFYRVVFELGNVYIFSTFEAFDIEVICNKLFDSFRFKLRVILLNRYILAFYLLKIEVAYSIILNKSLKIPKCYLILSVYGYHYFLFNLLY